MPGGERGVEQVRADEAGAAGDRQLHSGDQRPFVGRLRARSPRPRSPSRSMIASSSGSMPSSSGAEIGKTVRAARLFERLQRPWRAACRRAGRPWSARSISGLSARPGAIAVELAADDRARPRPDPRPSRRPGGAAAACARHGRGSGRRCPAPSAAPSIRPGMSASDELAALVADDAELRAERRERIVADLGRGVGDRVEEGRLAGVGKADQADVGEQLEPQPDPHFLARPRRSGAGAGRGWSRSCSWRCRGRPCRP